MTRTERDAALALAAERDVALQRLQRGRVSQEESLAASVLQNDLAAAGADRAGRKRRR